MGSILDLLGKADNLSDPMPILNERAAVLGMVISFLVVAWICGIFRLYVRFFVAHCLGWDDFFVVLAMSFYVCGGAYAMATALIKLALLFQYLRMFEAGSKSRFVTLVVIYITAAWGLAYSFLAFIPCFPVSAFWNLTTVTKDRWAFGSHDPVIFARTFESHVGMNVALDLIVFLIPLRLFLEQGLRAKSRLGLLGLFTMGVLVNILGIFRLIGISHSQAGTYPTLDPSWYGCVPIVLAAVEVNLATICASLPIFWPVLQMNLGKIFITKEIEITSEVRRFSGDEEMVGELGDLSPQKSLKSLGRDPNPRWSDMYAPSPDRSRAMKVHVEVESGHKHGEKLFVSERSRRVLDDHESQEHIVSSNVPYV
ncbi:hypothetical protein COL26b_010920 [Colletotrichum chrysophilum]|uniref:uncharacterized protein n=1 Tax=Colletotrichum chrysophilum TaxID=1836956 RepID=UPI0023006610|nr:uncharacterized protein COL26b_010920 [Colletotrichum chrysophilum]KAJ0274769.1 hypothetical protein COL940_009166 [Colletotrichum noveboracense]KAJ0281506.1 hypothetical protein CBS470a_008255 [Colletotrichum nupharicola]KAJ0368269.1 hypothetical protein COL26b_010920 [Colletotrichum chrysophilum]